LLAILLVATFSIPVSTLFVGPFQDYRSGVIYTGLSMETLKDNMMPRFTKGAAGSGINEEYVILFRFISCNASWRFLVGKIGKLCLGSCSQQPLAFLLVRA
jgi:hypothetical protein